MDARGNAPPFGRGETAYGGRTIDTANLDFADLLGRTHQFEDINWNTTSGSSAKPTLSGFLVTVVAIRNLSGAALLPKRLIKIDVTDAGGCSTTGYTTTVNDANVAVVDEYLPAAGVPDKDVFWAVVKGPTTCISPHTGDFAANIVAGDDLVAATTSATFHGRPLSAQTVTTNSSGSPTTASTDSLSKATRNRFGKAIAGVTTGNVDTDFRVHVRPGL